MIIDEKMPRNNQYQLSAKEFNQHRRGWNEPGHTSPGMRRHYGGQNNVAADGHARWLRMPRFDLGSGEPETLGELGDALSGDGFWARKDDQIEFVREFATPEGFR